MDTHISSRYSIISGHQEREEQEKKERERNKGSEMTAGQVEQKKKSPGPKEFSQGRALTGFRGGRDRMNSRMTSWALFFNLGGMSPFTCSITGERAEGKGQKGGRSWAETPETGHSTLESVP